MTDTPPNPPLVCFHNHLVPGVDDGARSAEEARDALLAMRDLGVRRLVATPHLSGELTERPAALERRLEEIDAGWDRLLGVADAAPEVTLSRGAEIMLDTPRPRLDDPRLRLGGGSAVLVEFSWGGLPPRVEDLLHELKAGGARPVAAHPERYREMRGRGVERIEEWRRLGVVIQINAGSITGRYGREVERTAWTLLERGWVDAVCSDFHPRPGHAPLLGKAYEALLEVGAEEQAGLLFSVNPGRVLDGEEPEPVPPVRRGLLQSLRRRLARRG